MTPDQRRAPAGAGRTPAGAGRVPAGPGGAGWKRLAFAIFAVGFGANQIAPLLPAYRDIAGLSDAQTAFILSVYVVGLIPALLVGGPCSDRFGRRTVVRPGLIAALAGSVFLLIGGILAANPAVSPAANSAANPGLALALLVLGRLCLGAAIGLTMSAALPWLKWLSGGDARLAAKRTTMSLSAGFAIGPLISGTIGEFLPRPLELAFIIHAVLMLMAIGVGWGIEEASVAGAQSRALPAALLRPAFWVLIALWAPWVFGVTSTSIAVLPYFYDSDLTVFTAGIIGTVTMGCGVLIQPAVAAVEKRTSAPMPVIGMGFVIAGMAVTMLAITLHNVIVTVLAALILGAAYGILLVSGLQGIQILGHDGELGALSSAFYSLSYLGFFVPYVIALINPAVSYRAIFGAGAVVAAAMVVPVYFYSRRALHLR